MNKEVKIKLLELLIGEEESPNNTEASEMIGANVIIRTYSAGVHIGTLLKKSNTNVLLSNARRLWAWEGAFTLNEVATKGITGGRVSCPVDKVELTQAIEIIPITEKALETVKNYEEEE